MKRVTLLAATTVLVAANAWTLVSVSQNQSDARGGRVELTERELRLPAESGESTAIFLELEWNTSAGSRFNRGVVSWLDPAKLSELGFDCSVPVAETDARDHYRSQMTALIFLVLELQSDASQQATTNAGIRSRLVPVDAGRDPGRLREKFPDNTRHILTRGLVRLVYRDRGERNEEPLAPARVEGRIAAVLPGKIFVPPPYSNALTQLRRRDGSDRDPPGGEPRYAVTVSWGADYHPWITGLRLLPHAKRELSAP